MQNVNSEIKKVEKEVNSFFHKKEIENDMATMIVYNQRIARLQILKEVKELIGNKIIFFHLLHSRVGSSRAQRARDVLAKHRKKFREIPRNINDLPRYSAYRHNNFLLAPEHNAGK